MIRPMKTPKHLRMVLKMKKMRKVISACRNRLHRHVPIGLTQNVSQKKERRLINYKKKRMKESKGKAASLRNAYKVITPSFFNLKNKIKSELPVTSVDHRKTLSGLNVREGNFWYDTSIRDCVR